MIGQLWFLRTGRNQGYHLEFIGHRRRQIDVLLLLRHIVLPIPIGKQVKCPEVLGAVGWLLALRDQLDVLLNRLNCQQFPENEYLAVLEDRLNDVRLHFRRRHRLHQGRVLLQIHLFNYLL